VSRNVTVLRWAVHLSTAVIVLGVAVSIGWIFHVESLKRVLPGLESMKLNTALGFILAGTVIHFGRRAKHVAVIFVCASVIGVLGGLTLAEYVFGWDLRIDQLILEDTSTHMFPGRMSPITALAFSFTGACLLLGQFRSMAAVRVRETLALLVAVLGLSSLIGYLYSVVPFYRVSSYTATALHTSAGLIVLGLAMLTSQSGSTVTLLTSQAAGRITARRLLPWAIAIPVFVGWLWVLGESYGWYETRVGAGLVVVAMIVVFSAAIYWNA